MRLQIEGETVEVEGGDGALWPRIAQALRPLGYETRIAQRDPTSRAPSRRRARSQRQQADRTPLRG